MNSKRSIRRNITTLTKFEPMSPKKIHYINTLTKYNTMTELINLVKQKKQFVIETKYDEINGCPKLIHILFAHKFVLHIILVETLYLPEIDFCLHHQIQCLFSFILSESNEIQSWNDIKSDLLYFLDCSLFTRRQIQNIQAISIQHKFQAWFREKFSNIKLNYIPSNNWTIENAIAFLFQQYFDTSLSNSRDWNIGLFAHFDTDYDPNPVLADRCVLNLLKDNKRRSVLGKYAIHECMAVNKIAALLQNHWTRQHGESYLKKYYSNA